MSTPLIIVNHLLPVNQWRSLGFVGAHPVEQKKGADRGIYGKIYFYDSPYKNKKIRQIIISVKSGKVTVSQVRDLVGIVEREKAAIGVFISLNPSTREMKKEALNAGFYVSPELEENRYPQIQLFTTEELLNGKHISYPKYAKYMGDLTFKKAKKVQPKKKEKKGKQKTLH